MYTMPTHDSSRLRMLAAAAGWLALLAFGLSPALAVTPLDFLDVSPDITVDLSGTTVNDEDLAEDDLVSLVVLIDIGTLPGNTALDAAHEVSSGNHLLSFETTVVLAGGLTAEPVDVVEFDGFIYSLIFDGSAEGVPNGVNVDAVPR